MEPSSSEVVEDTARCTEHIDGDRPGPFPLTELHERATTATTDGVGDKENLKGRWRSGSLLHGRGVADLSPAGAEDAGECAEDVEELQLDPKEEVTAPCTDLMAGPHGLNRMRRA